MKSKTLLLTKILLKSGEGFGVNFKKKSTLFLFVLMAIFLVPIILYTYLQVISYFYQALAMIGQEGVLLSYGLLLSSLIVFIFGFFYIVSGFYFSNDIENFLPLPVKPRQIVGAKFLVAVLYEYLITAFVYLPILLYYGFQQQMGFVYYLFGFAIFPFIPVFPLALSAVVVMLIMRIFNLSRYREQFKIFGGIVGLLAGISVNMAIQKFTRINPDEIQQLLEAGNNSLLNVINRVFPTLHWATTALFEKNILSGLINLLIFVALSIGVYLLILVFGELVYLKGVIGISEAGSKRHRVDVSGIGKLIKQRTPIYSYTLNEIRLLIRTPIYFLNCILPNFIWPFFLLPGLLSGEMVNVGELIAQVSELLNEPGYAGHALGIFLAFVALLSGANGISATTISREGQGIFIKHYIPVSYEDQITAKLLSSVIISYTGVISILIPFSIILKLPLYLVLSAFIMSIFPLILTGMSGLIFDILNPKLVWENEQKAVKQNMNVMYNLGVSMVLGLVIVVLTFLFFDHIAKAIIVLSLLFLIACYLLARLLYSYGKSSLRQIEV